MSEYRFSDDPPAPDPRLTWAGLLLAWALASVVLAVFVLGLAALAAAIAGGA